MKTIYIIRHGETLWSKSGQHTGLTDLELTPEGIAQAKKLSKRLQTLPFDYIFCSPLKRAKMTCEICGLLSRAQIAPDLREWNYGDYEGLTSTEIKKRDPNWNLFSDGAPGGESLSDVQKRADHFWNSVKNLEGSIALFTSGHISRALAARHLKLSVSEGRLFVLQTASLSILGFEHKLPVIQLWNDTSHLRECLQTPIG